MKRKPTMKPVSPKKPAQKTAKTKKPAAPPKAVKAKKPVPSRKAAKKIAPKKTAQKPAAPKKATKAKKPFPSKKPVAPKTIAGAANFAVFDDVLSRAEVGSWKIEIEEGKEPRMYVDKTMQRLIGVKPSAKLTPEETYHAWYDRVDPAHYDAVGEGVGHMMDGDLAEIQYPWHHPDGRIIEVRCGGTRDKDCKSCVRVTGIHQWVTTMHHVDRDLEAKERKLRDSLARLASANRHERLRADAFDFMQKTEKLEDFVEFFSGRILDLYGCDQVIYRDVEGRQILKERPGTKPLDFSLCENCPHYEFDAPVYKGGFTAMDDCKVGYNGIPVHPHCRVRASLTYLVYEDEKVYGYIALHYLDGTHRFSDEEKNTFNRVASFMSLVLSRRKRRAIEEKRREETIRREADTMMALLEDLDSLFVMDPATGDYTIYLGGATDIEKYTVMGRKGHNLYEEIPVLAKTVIHEDDRKQFLAYFNPKNVRKIAETGVPQELESRWFVKGGTRWMRNKTVRRVDASGNVSVIIGVWDTTEKQAQAQAQQEGLLLRSFGAMINAATWSMEITGNDRIDSVTWSNEFRHMVGCEGEKDFPNALESWSDRLHPEERDLVLKHFWAGIREATDDFFYDNVFRLRKKDGSFAWVHGYGRIEKKSDKAKRFYGIAVDVTPEKELELRNTRFEILKDLIHSALWNFRINESDEIVAAEYSADLPKVVKVDMDPTTAPADVWRRLVHPEDRDAALAAFDAAIADHTGKTPYDVVYRMVDRDGNYNWFHSAGSIIRHEDGTGDFFGIHIDITKTIEKEREQQKQLEEALSMAKSANRAKSTFLFNMSHDIRTPMNAILGFNEIALKSLDDRGKIEDCLHKSMEAGELLLTLINNVLDMSRVESGKAKLEERPADAMLSFANVEATMHELARLKGVELTFGFGRVVDRYVYADYQRTARIFVNIISNAIKYTNPGGYVHVTCEQVGAAADGHATFRYVFEDNGIGMSEEFLGHIFEEFSRERNSTVSGIQGTGLGMALCKSLVDLLGGTIECRSKQGAGTTFTVTLPFRLQSRAMYVNPETGSVESAEPGTKKKLSPAAFRGKRVLLVEDNVLNREVAEYLLRENGMILESATNGEMALSLVRLRGFGYYDFILMDIQMPVMDGYEATRAIRDWERTTGSAPVPIIALSANAFAEDREASFAAGMDGHVAKPIKIDELFDCLSRFL